MVAWFYAQDVDSEVIVGLQAETRCMEAQWLMPDNISPVLQGKSHTMRGLPCA